MDLSNVKKNIINSSIGGGGFSLQDLVNRVQGFCLGMRLTHWETTSYELHKAVEATQDSMEETLDAFVEAYIGMGGGKRPKFNERVEKSTDEDALITYLKAISIKDTSILNIRDEFLQHLYKFKYLKTLT